MPKKKQIGTAERFREAGKIGVLLGFMPDEHEKVKEAAKAEKRSMAQFIIFHAIEASRKAIGK
jgi:uncharacterized protein (DUF1778 family)